MNICVSGCLPLPEALIHGLTKIMGTMKMGKENNWRDAWLPGIDFENTTPRDDRVTVKVNADNIKKTIEKLVNEKNFRRIVTITGIDLGQEIELMYHLTRKKLIVSVITGVLKKNPTVTSIIDVFPIAAIYEREVHEMFGVNFVGNPDLSPLLLPDDWPGNVHPLRSEWTLTKLRNRLDEN